MLKVDAEQFAALEKVAEKVYRAGVCPPDVKSADMAFAVMLAGAELGLGPMQALRCIQIMKQKLTFTADFTVALAVRAPDCEYFRLVESNDQRATFETKRRGHAKPVTLTWTIEQAKRAGLTGNSTWKNHTEAMLRARCSAALARSVYPDHVAGMYTPDEGEEIARNDNAGPAEDGAPSETPPQEQPSAPEGLGAYRARLAAALTVDELVAAVLALAPTVATCREAAWSAAQGRAAELGEQDLGAAVARASAVTKEPSAWTTAAKVLGELAAAANHDEVGAVVKRHGAAVMVLPQPLRSLLSKASARRREALKAPPLYAQFEGALRGARDLPTAEGIGDQIAAAFTAGQLTRDEVTALSKLQDDVASAMEREAA